MRVRVRIRCTPLSWWRGGKNCETEAASRLGGHKNGLAAADNSETQPTICVTCSPGSLPFGPTVALGIKTADKRGLLVEMNVDEASDLANELLMAVQMSERKYELQFGTPRRPPA
jgi:hypothetical protein